MMTTREKIMVIVATIITVLVMGFIILQPTTGKLYQMNGYIYNVDFSEDYTLIITDDGNVWGMNGTETWPKGTRVIVTFGDSNTTTLVDDCLLKVEKTR